MKQEIKMGDDYSVNETGNQDGSWLLCPIQKRSEPEKNVDQMAVLAKFGGELYHLELFMLSAESRDIEETEFL